jgi:hypothetical protein
VQFFINQHQNFISRLSFSSHLDSGAIKEANIISQKKSEKRAPSLPQVRDKREKKFTS